MMMASPPTAAVATFLALFACAVTISGVRANKLCEGELGQANWACETLSPVSATVFGEFLPLPGDPDPANPILYEQISGEPAFDEVTGERTGNSAAFVLTDGTYMAMLAESNGEAALFDAPEGSFTSSTTPFPTSSWLPESMKALLAEGTKLKYMVYTHSHWDHIGNMGSVATYFADDEPQAIASRRTRRRLKLKAKNDPDSVFGNNRGVPLPEWYEEDVLEVGGLRFTIDKAHVHMTGDYIVLLDKDDHENSAEAGIDTSVLMVVDAVFPGWSPFFSLAIAQNVQAYYEGLDKINGYDFDVLVAGHFTRLGNKEDVQAEVDYMADILAGAELGVSTVLPSDIAIGTNIGDPTDPNFGNSWLFFNEYLERVVDVCYDYVLDSDARGRDWLVDLSGVEPTLRSHCWTVQNGVRVG
ncbi:unnamed protein product [Scytosiphon promiscuus]